MMNLEFDIIEIDRLHVPNGLPIEGGPRMVDGEAGGAPGVGDNDYGHENRAMSEGRRRANPKDVEKFNESWKASGNISVTGNKLNEKEELNANLEGTATKGKNTIKGNVHAGIENNEEKETTATAGAEISYEHEFDKCDLKVKGGFETLFDGEAPNWNLGFEVNIPFGNDDDKDKNDENEKPESGDN